MLRSTKLITRIHRNRFALLFVISIVTFPQNVFAADIKTKTIEEYRAKGYQEKQKGNLNEALNYYTKAVEIGLDNPSVYNDMGILFEEVGFDLRAEQHYRKAIQADSNYLPAYINLAYLYKKNKNLEKAAQYFQKRYELGTPGDPWAEKAKDELIALKPEYREWIIRLEAEKFNDQLIKKAHADFVDMIKRANEHYEQGQAQFDQANYQEALKEFNQALSITPDNPKVIDARKKTILELSKINVKEHSDQAIKMLNSGDSLSAKSEIQKMLTAIPNEPIITSK